MNYSITPLYPDDDGDDGTRGQVVLPAMLTNENGASMKSVVQDMSNQVLNSKPTALK